MSLSRQLMIFMGVSLCLFSTLPSFPVRAVSAIFRDRRNFQNPGSAVHVNPELVSTESRWPGDMSRINFPLNFANRKKKAKSLQEILKAIEGDTWIPELSVKENLLRIENEDSAYERPEMISAHLGRPGGTKNIFFFPLNSANKEQISKKFEEILKFLNWDKWHPVGTPEDHLVHVENQGATNVRPNTIMSIGLGRRGDKKQTIFFQPSSANKEKIAKMLQDILQSLIRDEWRPESTLGHHLFGNEYWGAANVRSQTISAELGWLGEEKTVVYFQLNSANIDKIVKTLQDIVQSLCRDKSRPESTLGDHWFGNENQGAAYVMPQLITTVSRWPVLTSIVQDPHNTELKKQILKTLQMSLEALIRHRPGPGATLGDHLFHETGEIDLLLERLRKMARGLWLINP